MFSWTSLIESCPNASDVGYSLRRKVLQEMKRFLIAALAFIGCTFQLSEATPQAPSKKPPAQYVSNVLSETDIAEVSAALEAADSGAWSVVRRLRGRLDDQDARNLLLWRITTDTKSGAKFNELNAALDLLKDWPSYNAIRRQAEAKLWDSSLSDRERGDWLERNPPITGDGKLELARLLRNSGSGSDADNLIRDVWRSHSMSYTTRRELEDSFGDLLTREDHAARMEFLLWSGQRSEAHRLIKKLSPQDRLVADARLRMMERRRGVDAAVRAVPRSRQSDPGVLYERAKWRRQRVRDIDAAIELLLQIDASKAIPSARDDIWKERRVALRHLIKHKRWKEAYAISVDHHIESGVHFAEAEFYAGWVSLRYLDDAQTAYEHFDRMSEKVGAPISLGRAHYWRGRALARLGRNEDAANAYRVASRQIFTFYGQLAAEELRKTDGSSAEISFPEIDTPSNEKMAAFLAKPVVRGARLLAETGHLRTFEKFSNHVDDMLETPVEHQMLFNLAESYLQPRAGVRNGKTGLARGALAPDAAYPLIELPNSGGGGSAEKALVIALSRQESELQPDARSHANARGMMQLLPTTGRQTARSIGAPYRTSWLTDDPTYNLRLGRTYLDGLVDRFNGSYIMALAAYNAGPSRPARWIKDYGDPRTGEIDPIDWIESIPFSETRNYVQRIMENLQVYRHRLEGQPTQIRLTSDLRRGSLRR